MEMPGTQPSQNAAVVRRGEKVVLRTWAEWRSGDHSRGMEVEGKTPPSADGRHAYEGPGGIVRACRIRTDLGVREAPIRQRQYNEGWPWSSSGIRERLRQISPSTRYRSRKRRRSSAIP